MNAMIFMETRWLVILAAAVLAGIIVAMIVFIPDFLAKKRIKEGRYCKTCAYYAKHTGFCISPKVRTIFDPERGEYIGSRQYAMRIYNTRKCKWKEREDEYG